MKHILSDEKKWTPCACVCDVSADETPSELLSVAKEVRTESHFEGTVHPNLSGNAQL